MRAWGGAALLVSYRPVQGAFDPHRSLTEDVGVEHGGAYVSMAQQFLYRADVTPRFEQVGGKAMPKRVATRRLQYTGAAHRRLYCALDCSLVHVVAHRTARIDILAIAVGGKYVLPTPLSRSVGIFVRQRIRQRHARRTRCSLLFESNAQFLQVHSKRMADCPRQHRDPILATLRVTNDQFAAFQTYVLDAQPQRFHQTQPAAV